MVFVDAAPLNGNVTATATIPTPVVVIDNKSDPFATVGACRHRITSVLRVGDAFTWLQLSVRLRHPAAHADSRPR